MHVQTLFRIIFIYLLLCCFFAGSCMAATYNNNNNNDDDDNNNNKAYLEFFSLVCASGKEQMCTQVNTNDYVY